MLWKLCKKNTSNNDLRRICQFFIVSSYPCCRVVLLKSTFNFPYRFFNVFVSLLHTFFSWSQFLIEIVEIVHRWDALVDDDDDHVDHVTISLYIVIAQLDKRCTISTFYSCLWSEERKILKKKRIRLNLIRPEMNRLNIPRREISTMLHNFVLQLCVSCRSYKKCVRLISKIASFIRNFQNMMHDVCFINHTIKQQAASERWLMTHSTGTRSTLTEFVCNSFF